MENTIERLACMRVGVRTKTFAMLCIHTGFGIPSLRIVFHSHPSTHRGTGYMCFQPLRQD